MATIYLGLGTNLGDKEANLRTAIYKLQERIGKQVSLSSFYETAPWGFKSDHRLSECSNRTGNQSLPYRSASYHAGNRERTRQDKEISQRQLQRPTH